MEHAEQMHHGTAKGSAPKPPAEGDALPPRPAYRWYLAAGAVAAATAFVGLRLYPDLPPSLPTHWNGAGQADSFAAKSVWSVFSVPLGSAGLVLFMLGLAVFLPRLTAAGGQLRTADSPAAQAANLRATQFFLGGTTLALSLLLAWFTLRGWLLPPDGSALYFILPLLALIAVMAGLGLLARRRYRNDLAGSGASDPARPSLPGADPTASSDDMPASDPVDDPRHYRAGIIYVNRADPRVLVPKRLGVGLSVNAGHPGGLAFYLGLAVLSLAAVVAGIAAPLLGH